MYFPVRVVSSAKPGRKAGDGFTLAELLISLAILGVIATFTIPKVLSAQQNQTFRAIAKETVSTIASAYTAYKQNTTPPATFKVTDLSPYLNYVRVDTSTDIDLTPVIGGTLNCGTAGYTCLRLHNGSMLMVDNNWNFGGTSPTGNAVHFFLDPDGKAGGNADSISFVLQYNGRVFVNGEASGACANNGCYTVNAAAIPSWFSWN